MPQRTEPPALFILKYKRTQVLIAPPQDYARLQWSIRDHFPNIPDDHRVSYFTKNLPVCKGVMTKISREVWPSAIPKLDHLIVRSEVARVSPLIKEEPVKNPFEEEQDLEYYYNDDSDDVNKSPKKKHRRDSLPQSAPVQKKAKKGLNLHIISIMDEIEEQRSADFSPATTVKKLSSWITTELGFFKRSAFRIKWRGRKLDNDDGESLASLGVQDGDKIYVIEPLGI